MFELFSSKPRCTSKTYAMTNNVKYILPWNPVYKDSTFSEPKISIKEKMPMYFRKHTYKLQN